jgi:pimeloyl-ACP methyl ester carboxylesterase
MAVPPSAPAGHAIPLRDGAVEFHLLTAGDGPPLVYFHSFHERGGWSPFLERLAGRFTVWAPFHPGVRGSTGVESLEDGFDLTLAYDELLGALGLDAAHLVGHFFGAMVAAELAAVFPRRARRLALLSPLGLWRDDAPSADVLILPPAELAAVLWTDPDSPVARAWATLPEAEAENIEAQIESIQRRAAMGKFVWPIPDRGLTKRLHRITAPTLILWGEGDQVNPVAYASEWQRRIKSAELRLVRGGHMLLHEAPGPTAATVEEFLG